MTSSRLFVWFALAASAALPGASTLAAQDWRGAFQNNREVRQDFRDTRQDRARIERLRNEIAREEVRLHEAIRRGRRAETSRLAADLARDQQELRFLTRNVRYDRTDAYRDSRNGYVNR